MIALKLTLRCIPYCLVSGTLLDTLDIISRTNNEVLRSHGFPTHTIEEYKSFVGDGMRMLMRRALPKGTSEEVVSALLPEVLDLYHEKGVGTIPPFPGIRETLSGLVERGVKISILTNKEHKYALLNAETILGEFKFDAILGIVELLKWADKYQKVNLVEIRKLLEPYSSKVIEDC